jgi:hypothetical protein
MSVKGSTLTIEVNLDKTVGTSNSQKNTLIAKLGGNIPIPGAPDKYGDVKVGLNVYKPVA